MVGQKKKNKANSARKDNTPTNHPNSGETGHFSEPENKRSSMTTRNETPVLTAGVAALTSGEGSPLFVMAGNQEAFQMSGCTRMSAVDLQDGGGGPIRGRFTRCRTTHHPCPLRRFDGGYNSSAGQSNATITKGRVRTSMPYLEQSGPFASNWSSWTRRTSTPWLLTLKQKRGLAQKLNA